MFKLLCTNLICVSLLCINATPLKMNIPSTKVNLTSTKIRQLASAMWTEKSNNSFKCNVCSSVVDWLRELIAKNTTEKVLNALAIDICIGFKIVEEYACKSIVNVYKSEFYYVLEKSVITSKHLCTILLSGCGHKENLFNEPWSIVLPDKTVSTNSPWPAPKNPQSTLKVLHLSDIHIDRWYVEGSEANCNKEFWLKDYAQCCRDYLIDGDTMTVNNRKPAKTPAGKWGSLSTCDIPFSFFDFSMKHIAKSHKLDYIIITGDMASHAIWDYNKDTHRENIENITKVLLENFPNTMIFQAIGNHEGVPMDAFAPHSIDDYSNRGPGWMYELLAKNWLNWLPNSTKPGIEYRGSYSIRPYLGLKLISLNTIYCSHFNFYLYINSTDPDSTMQWLIFELLDAEVHGERVHIVSHIPPGNDYCMQAWTQNYYKLVDRFRDTITAQFFGHTHYDQFQVYFENEDATQQPFQFHFISPSLTTYPNINPSYRIYTIDGNYTGSTFSVLETETYYANLTEANLPGHKPNYVLEYKLPEEYDMPDLSPASWADLINRLKNNDTLFTKYYTYYNRLPTPCNAKCKMDTLCEARTAEVGKSFCDDLKSTN